MPHQIKELFEPKTVEEAKEWQKQKDIMLLETLAHQFEKINPGMVNIVRASLIPTLHRGRILSKNEMHQSIVDALKKHYPEWLVTPLAAALLRDMQE